MPFGGLSLRTELSGSLRCLERVRQPPHERERFGDIDAVLKRIHPFALPYRDFQGDLETWNRTRKLAKHAAVHSPLVDQIAPIGDAQSGRKTVTILRQASGECAADSLAAFERPSVSADV